MYKWLFWHKVQVVLETTRGRFKKELYFKYEPKVGDKVAIGGLGLYLSIAIRTFIKQGLSVSLSVPSGMDLSALSKDGWEVPLNYGKSLSEEKSILPIAKDISWPRRDNENKAA